jgi:hypothetical protein
MGEMPKSNEAMYLDNLLWGMEKVVDGISPHQYDVDNPDNLGIDRWLVAGLSTLVTYAMVADLIAQYAPTKDSQKRLAKANKLFNRGCKKVTSLARVWGVDLTPVIPLGVQATEAMTPYLVADDFSLQFEYGHKGHANYRRKAAVAVLGRSEQDDIDVRFWNLILHL